MRHLNQSCSPEHEHFTKAIKEKVGKDKTIQSLKPATSQTPWYKQKTRNCSEIMETFLVSFLQWSSVIAHKSSCFSALFFGHYSQRKKMQKLKMVLSILYGPHVLVCIPDSVRPCS